MGKGPAMGHRGRIQLGTGLTSGGRGAADRNALSLLVRKIVHEGIPVLGE